MHRILSLGMRRTNHKLYETLGKSFNIFETQFYYRHNESSSLLVTTDSDFNCLGSNPGSSSY